MPKPNVREQIVTAGLAALHGKGFNATSVQDITEAAGVPKGSFYNHFESKDALGAEVVQRYRAAAEARRAVLKDSKLAPLLRLRRYFEALNSIGAESGYSIGCLLGNFGSELSGQSPLIRGHVAAAFDHWGVDVAAVIAEAQRAGDMSKDLAPKAIAAFLVNAWQGSVMRAKVEQDRAPLDLFLKVTLAKILV